VKATQQILAVAWTKTHKILIVDDTQDNLDLMVEVLEEGPWTVVTVRDAESALGQSTETAFDLFLLDVHMPDVPTVAPRAGYSKCPRHIHDSRRHFCGKCGRGVGYRKI